MTRAIVCRFKTWNSNESGKGHYNDFEKYQVRALAWNRIEILHPFYAPQWFHHKSHSGNPFYRKMHSWNLVPIEAAGQRSGRERGGLVWKMQRYQSPIHRDVVGPLQSSVKTCTTPTRMHQNVATVGPLFLRNGHLWHSSFINDSTKCTASRNETHYRGGGWLRGWVGWDFFWSTFLRLNSTHL